jgi:hypothetical protein
MDLVGTVDPDGCELGDIGAENWDKAAYFGQPTLAEAVFSWSSASPERTGSVDGCIDVRVAASAMS